jgi:phosphohistidine phosphatase
MNNPRNTRHIILMRHAQSAGKQPGQADRDRTLTQEGEDRARKTGLTLHRLSEPPDYMISSSATRAKVTAHCVNEALTLSPLRLHFFDNLYEATASDWEQQLILLPLDCCCVLCIGHNPAISLLASEFAGRTIDLEPGAFSTFVSSANEWKSFRIGLTELSPATTR